MAQSFEDIVRRIKEMPSIGKKLLAQGKRITYVKNGVHIAEYPDGRKYVIRTVNGERVEQEPYED